MIKLIFLCRRRPDVSHERYVELLLRGHVPIALRHHPTLRKYVVNIVEVSPPGRELDSIGELYFETLADFRDRLYDSPAGERIVSADVAGFMGGAAAYVVAEQAVRPAPQPPMLGARTPLTKIMTCFRRAADVGSDAFDAHWHDRHTPLVLAEAPPLGGYVRNVVTERLGRDGPPWDGIETQYVRPGGADADWPAENAVAADRRRFVAETARYVVAEYVEKLPP
jgi:hypothetical protein